MALRSELPHGGIAGQLDAGGISEKDCKHFRHFGRMGGNCEKIPPSDFDDLKVGIGTVQSNSNSERDFPIPLKTPKKWISQFLPVDDRPYRQIATVRNKNGGIDVSWLCYKFAGCEQSRAYHSGAATIVKIICNQQSQEKYPNVRKRVSGEDKTCRGRGN